MRRFGLYAALALCVCGLAATAASTFEHALNQAKAFLPYRSNGRYRLKMA